MATRDELAARFRRFAATTASRAPLYAQLADVAASDPVALDVLDSAASDEQAQPVLFFAALHHLVLTGRAPRLADHYPTAGRAHRDEPTVPGTMRAQRTPRALDADFVRTVHEHADDLRSLVATRRTQTNEIGRAALFTVAFGTLERRIERIAHLDIGASAGLNLRLHRYRHIFGTPGGDHETLIGTGSDTCCDIRCELTGLEPPIRIPQIGCAIGLDSAPVDLADDDAVRWLEACVWPDQLDRFDRLRAALDDARRDPPDVRRGDAVDDLPAVLGEVCGSAGTDAHPVVTTSWVLAYLADDRRRAFVEVLDRHGRREDLTWVIAESPFEAPGLPYAGVSTDERLTELTVVRWRGGERSSTCVGTAHPHGYWLRAFPAPPSATSGRGPG